MNTSKCFLSTLIAAAAMSSAVYADVGLNKGSIQWAESFGDGYSQAATFGMNNAFHVENGYGVAGGNHANSRVWTTNTGGKFTNAFTFSFELVDFDANNWTDALALYTNGTKSGENNSIQLQKNANNELMVYTSNFTGSNVTGDDSNINLGSIANLKGKVITLSFDGTGATKTLTAYVDGVANTDTVTFTYAEDVTPSTALTGFQFGAAFGNQRVSNSVTVDNIVVSNTAQCIVQKNLDWAGEDAGSWADATWSDGQSIGNNVIANVTFGSSVTMTTDTNVWLGSLNVSGNNTLSLVAGKNENGEVVPGTISAYSLILGDGATLNLGGNVALDLGGGNVSLGGRATVNISGSATVTGTFSGAGSLNVNDGGMLELVGADNSTNQTAGTINVNGGGTLKFSGHDLMGWGGSANVAAALQGESEEKFATLFIDDTGSASGLTFSRSIEMKGNAVISTNLPAGKLNSFGGGITASGTNNKIEKLTIMMRENLEVNVSGKDDVLSISGSIVSHKNANGATEGKGVFNKTGDGVLILSGDNSGLTTDKDGDKRVISVSSGTLVAAHANALGSGKVTVASGATLGFVAETTVMGVTGGIELENGAQLLIDMSKLDLSKYPTTLADGTNTISLNLVSGVAIKYNDAELNDDNIDKIRYELTGWNNSGWTSSLVYANDTLSLTLTIPEPSTFGLLAGLGALTLVGTRRRRKKA